MRAAMKTPSSCRCGPEQTVVARMNWGPGLFNLSAIGMTLGRKMQPPDADEAAILDALSDRKRHASNQVVQAAMDHTKHKRRTVQAKLKAMADAGIVGAEEAGSGKPYQVWLPEPDPFDEAMK